MAKVIEKENGEWIIASDDVPEDLIYHEDYKPPVTLQNAANTIKTNLLQPVSFLISFLDEDLPTIPIQVNKFYLNGNRCRVKGIILSTDFAWLVTKLENKIQKIEMANEEQRSLMFPECTITKIIGKEMNKVTVTVDLFIAKHI